MKYILVRFTFVNRRNYLFTFSNCRHSAFQVGWRRPLKFITELLDVPLWVEVKAIVDEEPEEFKDIPSSDGKSSVWARQWSFVNVADFGEAMFLNVEIQSSNFMVVKIGKGIFV